MHKESFYFKATAFVVALGFLVTTVLSPSYSLAQEPIALSPQSFNFSLKDVLLPETIGTIQDLYSRTASDEKVIIEIQDAHGIFEAQKNIQELIQLFQDKYQVNTIGLEGGVGWISSAVYRSLPDAEIKKKLVMDYLKRGELSGGEAAMILNPKKGDFYGIEDRDLYFKNRKAFIDNLKVRPGIMRSLDVLTQKLDTIRQSVYSAELRDFDEKVKDYRAERISLLDFVNILQAEAKTLGINIETTYPALWTLFIAEAKDREMALPEMQKEGSRFIREISTVIQKALPAEELREFNAKLQDHQTGQMDQVAFLQYLHGKASGHNIPIEKYEDIQSYFSYREDLQRLEGERLFSETDQLIKEIKRSHFRTDEEGELDSVYDHIDVIRKLANLEALHEDLALYEARPEEYKADFFNQFLAKYHDRLTVNWELSASERFYQYARERDQVLFDNFMKALKEKKQSKGILVTGGFHTEGLKVKFKEAGYSYLVLSPRITRFDVENPYEKVMSGQLSYYQPEQSKLQVILATAGMLPAQRDAFIKVYFKDGFDVALAKAKGVPGLEEFSKSWNQDLINDLRGEEGILTDPSKSLNMLTNALRSAVANMGGEAGAQAEALADRVAQAEDILRNAIIEGINKNYEEFSTKLKDFLAQANQKNLPISATSLAVLATGDVQTALRIAGVIGDISKFDRNSLNAAEQNIKAFDASQQAKAGEVIQAMNQVTNAVPEAYRAAALREAVALKEAQPALETVAGKSLGNGTNITIRPITTLVLQTSGGEQALISNTMKSDIVDVLDSTLGRRFEFSQTLKNIYGMEGADPRHMQKVTATYAAKANSKIVFKVEVSIKDEFKDLYRSAVNEEGKLSLSFAVKTNLGLGTITEDEKQANARLEWTDLVPHLGLSFSLHEGRVSGYIQGWIDGPTVKDYGVRNLTNTQRQAIVRTYIRLGINNIVNGKSLFFNDVHGGNIMFRKNKDLAGSTDFVVVDLGRLETADKSTNDFLIGSLFRNYAKFDFRAGKPVLNAESATAVLDGMREAFADDQAFNRFLVDALENSNKKDDPRVKLPPSVIDAIQSFRAGIFNQLPESEQVRLLANELIGTTIVVSDVSYGAGRGLSTLAVGLTERFKNDARTKTNASNLADKVTKLLETEEYRVTQTNDDARDTATFEVKAVVGKSLGVAVRPLTADELESQKGKIRNEILLKIDNSLPRGEINYTYEFNAIRGDLKTSETLAKYLADVMAHFGDVLNAERTSPTPRTAYITALEEGITSLKNIQAGLTSTTGQSLGKGDSEVNSVKAIQGILESKGVSTNNSWSEASSLYTGIQNGTLKTPKDVATQVSAELSPEDVTAIMAAGSSLGVTDANEIAKALVGRVFTSKNYSDQIDRAGASRESILASELKSQLRISYDLANDVVSKLTLTGEVFADVITFRITGLAAGSSLGEISKEELATRAQAFLDRSTGKANNFRLSNELTEAQLTDLKKQFKHVIGMTTFSGQLVDDTTKPGVKAQLKVMLLERLQKGESVLAVIGATNLGGVKDGYDVLDEPEFKPYRDSGQLKTMGLVAAIGVVAANLSQDGKHGAVYGIRQTDYTYIHETGTGYRDDLNDNGIGGWGVESPTFQSFINELIAFGGGDQAAAEIAGVAENKPVTVLLGVKNGAKIDGEAELKVRVAQLGDTPEGRAYVQAVKQNLEAQIQAAADEGAKKKLAKQLKIVDKALAFTLSDQAKGNIKVVASSLGKQFSATPLDVFRAHSTFESGVRLPEVLAVMADHLPKGGQQAKDLQKEIRRLVATGETKSFRTALPIAIANTNILPEGHEFRQLLLSDSEKYLDWVTEMKKSDPKAYISIAARLDSMVKEGQLSVPEAMMPGILKEIGFSPDEVADDWRSYIREDIAGKSLGKGDSERSMITAIQSILDPKGVSPDASWTEAAGLFTGIQNGTINEVMDILRPNLTPEQAESILYLARTTASSLGKQQPARLDTVFDVHTAFGGIKRTLPKYEIIDDLINGRLSGTQKEALREEISRLVKDKTGEPKRFSTVLHIAIANKLKGHPLLNRLMQDTKELEKWLASKEGTGLGYEPVKARVTSMIKAGQPSIPRDYIDPMLEAIGFEPIEISRDGDRYQREVIEVARKADAAGTSTSFSAGKSLGGIRPNEIGFQRRSQQLDGAERTAFLEIANVLYDVGMINNAELEEGIVNLDFNIFQVLGGLDEQGKYVPGQSYDGDADFLHRVSELKGLLNKSNAMQPFAHSYNLIAKTLREVLKQIPPEKTALQNAIVNQYLDDIAVTGLYADVIGVSDLMPTPGARPEQRDEALKTRARFLQWFDKTRQDMAQKHSNLTPNAQEGIWQANYILYLATDWVKSDTDMLDMGKNEIEAVNRKVVEHLLSKVPATQPLRKGDLAVLPTALDQGDIVLKDKNGNITGPNPAYVDVTKPLAEGGFNWVYRGLDGTPLEGHVIKILKNKPLGLDGLEKKVSDRRKELTKLITNLLSPSMQSKELTSPAVVAEVNVLRSEKDQLTKTQGLLAQMRKTGISDPAALAEINKQVNPTYIDRLMAEGISPANSFYIEGESRAIIQTRGKPYIELINASIETLREAENLGPYREEAAQRLAAGLSRPGTTVGKSLGGGVAQDLEKDPMWQLAQKAEKFYAENADLLASETGVGSASVKTATRQMAEERIPGVSLDYLKSRDGKIVVVPDIHGNVEALIARLVQDGLISSVVFKKGTKEVESFQWTGGRAEVVFLGDLMDRDPHSQEVSDLVRAVQQKASAADGTVVRLAGNHEIGVLQLYGELLNAPEMKGRASELEELMGKSPAALTDADRYLLTEIVTVHSVQPINLRERIAPFYDQLMMSGDTAKILQALRLGRDLTEDAKNGDLVATHTLPSETGRQIVFAHSYVPPHLRFANVRGVWKELSGEQFSKDMNERFQKAAASGDFVTDLIFKTGAAVMGYEPVRGQNGDISLNNGQTAGGIFSTYHRELGEKNSLMADSSTFKASDTMFFIGGHTYGQTVRMGLDSMTIDKGAAQKYFGQVSALKISLKDGALNFQIDTIPLDEQNRPSAPSVDLEFGPARKAAAARAAEIIPIEDIQKALEKGQKVSFVTREAGTVREITKGAKDQFVVRTIKDRQSTSESMNLNAALIYFRVGYKPVQPSGLTPIAEVTIYTHSGTALLTPKKQAATPGRSQVVRVSPVFGQLGSDWVSQVGKIAGLKASTEALLKEGADLLPEDGRLLAYNAGDTIVGGAKLSPLEIRAAEQWQASERLKSRADAGKIFASLADQAGNYSVQVAPGTIDGKPSSWDGEAYELTKEALGLMPQDVLNSGVLKNIQLNAGRDQGARASAYNSGNVLMYPWAMKNRRTFAGLLLHEMGHGVADFLELNKDYASQLADLKKAWGILVEQSLFMGVDYGLGDAASRAGYQGLFDEFIAEMNMMYIGAGNRMREHINAIQDPAGKAAFISAYNAFKALHQGREFQEGGQYTAINAQAPQVARVNFAKLTPDTEKVRIKQSEILAWAAGKPVADPNVTALVNYLKTQKTDQEIAAFFIQLKFKDKSASADASAKTFKLFADKLLDELVIAAAPLGNEVMAQRQAAAVSNLTPSVLRSMQQGEAKVIRIGDLVRMDTTAYGADYAGIRELELGVNSKGELRLLDQVNRKKFAIGNGATVRFEDGSTAKVTINEVNKTITLVSGRSLGIDPELADEIKNLFEDDKKVLNGYDFTSLEALEDFKAQLNKTRDAFLANFTVISEAEGSLDLAFYKSVNLLVNDSRRDAIKFYNQSENAAELALELDPDKKSKVFKDSQKIVLDAITAAQQKLNPMGQPVKNVIRKDQPFVQALGWLQDAINKTQLKDLKPDTRNLAISGLVSVDMTSHPSSEMTGDDANVDISSDRISIRVADARGHGPKAAFLRQLASHALSMTPRDDSGVMDYGFTHRLMGSVLKTPSLSGLYSSETVFNFVPEAGGYKLLVDKLGGMDRSFIFSKNQPEAVKVESGNVRSRGVGLGLTSMEMKLPVGKYTPLTLAPGDLFVAFTDGIEEQIDDVEIGAYERDDIQDFQTSIIQEIKKRYDQNPNMDPDDVREFIREYLKANNIESGDDYTIVAFKMPPLDAAGQISLGRSETAFLKAHHQADPSDYFTLSARNEFQRKLIEKLRTTEEETLKEVAAVSLPAGTAPLKTFEGVSQSISREVAPSTESGAAGQSLGKEAPMENIKGFLIHGSGISTDKTIPPADIIEVANFINANRETPQVVLDAFDKAFQDIMNKFAIEDVEGLKKFVESIAQGTVQKSSFEAFNQALKTEVGTRMRIEIGEDAARQMYELIYRGTVVSAQSAAVTALTATSGLQALMLSDPKMAETVLNSWRKQFGLDVSAQKEIPIHATITTLISPEAVNSMLKAAGNDSLGNPLFTATIVLSPAEKEMKGYKELVQFVKDLNKQFHGQVQMSPVTMNKVTAAAKDANSALHSDANKAVLSANVTEASSINQKVSTKVMPVAYVSTGVQTLDNLIVAVVAQAARAENPTSYIQDKLKNMVRIENGVVVPIVTKILEEFQRQLEEARVQAIAA